MKALKADTVSFILFSFLTILRYIGIHFDLIDNRIELQLLIPTIQVLIVCPIFFSKFWL